MPTSTGGSEIASLPCAGQVDCRAETSSRLREKRGSNQSSLSSTSPSASSSSSSSSSSSRSSNGNGNQSQDGNCLSLLSSNTADYDHIRNTTLMFFLDRLFIASKDGKEARTLHDLSCLFGTKDFTKEMRQIVGASRNGLKKFLQSYPSLFTIEDDKVYLTQLRQEASVPQRDYNKEAVEYFSEKLKQFGPSLVPIKNLFGYRSQASQEVRHVSGRNTREFKQFLKNHEDVFEMLADEHVILKFALKELEAQGESRATIQRISSIQMGTYDVTDTTTTTSTTSTKLDSLKGSDAATSLRQKDGDLHCNIDGNQTNNGLSVMDPYLNKQFASQIEQTLAKILDAKVERNEERRVTLEYLHKQILAECQNPLFLKMVKTLDELKVFLRMHPKIFKREEVKSFVSASEATGAAVAAPSPSTSTSDDKNSNHQQQIVEYYVTLLTEEERKELQAYPSSSSSASHHHHQLSRLHSSLERSGLVSSSSISSVSSQQVGDSSGPMSLPPMNQNLATSNHHQQQKQATITPQQTQIKRSNTTATNESSSRISTKHQQLQQQSSALRANAPPFVPSAASPRSALQATMSNQMSSNLSRPFNRQSGNNRVQLQRSQSSLVGQQQSMQQRSPIVDPRQALRNHLVRASAENNASSGLYSASKLSNGAQYHRGSGINNDNNIINNNNNNLISNQNDQINNNSNANPDDLRARTVNIVREASNIITRIMSTADAVAFDCKGYNLGFNGQITLIQFGFIPKQQKQLLNLATGFVESDKKQESGDKIQKPEVCIFDLITNPELAYCLKPLLESDQIVKIVHDVRNKSNALHVQFGIMLNHVFDTQVANLVIQQQESGKPAYKSRYISMSKLCEVYGDESLMKYRNIIKSKTRHSGSSAINSACQSGKMKDVNYWRTRPLTDAMIYESTLDVYCLVGGIYQNLKSRIKPEYKPLFDQLILEGVLARIKPEEIRSVKKERKIDLEVIELKRKLYSESTGSIVLSNREIRLLRHIDLTDEVRDKIQHCKKVAKKLERLDMKAALVAQQSLQSGASYNSNNSNSNSDSSNPADASLDPQLVSMNESNGHSSGGTSLVLNTSQQQTNAIGTGSQATTCASDAAAALLAATSEQCISELMDGSMFDEFKDKMIETSSLLESLENDDDEDDAAMQSLQLHHHHSLSATTRGGEVPTSLPPSIAQHSHHQSHNYLDHPSVGSGSDCCCSCQCHRSSIATNATGSSTDNEREKTSLSAKSTHSTQSIDKEKEGETKKTKNETNPIKDNKEKEREDTEVQKNDEDRDSTGSKAVDMAVQCDLLS